jgi:hypothetical protein
MGQQVAHVLRGSWRRLPEPATLALADWAELAPLLVRTGAGGLAWWRLRHSELRDTAPARMLRDAYRLHALDARRQAMRLEEAIALLSAVGVEPLLAKGWAAARWYPEPGLRPYGDHDLYVSPEQHPAAVRALGGTQGGRWQVDLHLGAPDADADWRELWMRAEAVEIGGGRIRLLGAEDHLRLLCLHLLRHGAWRPLWLCDVGAALESLPDSFDWDLFLGGSRRTAEACEATLLLAGRMLGAKLEGTPLAGRDGDLPRWLVSATLDAWGTGGHYMHTAPMALVAPDPSSIFAHLRVRWPNPIEATMRRGGHFNHRPRLPLQAADVLSRLIGFALTAPGPLGRRLLRGWRSKPAH